LDDVTNVLVCDDDAEMRALLRLALDTDPLLSVVGEAADGSTAMRLAGTLQPHVVLVDIEMPGPPFGAVVTGVRRAAPAAAIVVLSAHGPECLDAEAAGVVAAHLLKTTDLGAVRRALREAGAAAR
jgi:DNA-binding NarL/FixJ family response regulator